jgi:hypothetical protein
MNHTIVPQPQSFMTAHMRQTNCPLGHKVDNCDHMKLKRQSFLIVHMKQTVKCPLNPRALLLCSHEADTCPVHHTVSWMFTWGRQLSLRPQSWLLCSHEADIWRWYPKVLRLFTWGRLCLLEPKDPWLFTRGRRLSLRTQSFMAVHMRPKIVP